MTKKSKQFRHSIVKLTLISVDKYKILRYYEYKNCVLLCLMQKYSRRMERGTRDEQKSFSGDYACAGNSFRLGGEIEAENGG